MKPESLLGSGMGRDSDYLREGMIWGIYQNIVIYIILIQKSYYYYSKDYNLFQNIKISKNEKFYWNSKEINNF